jgi:cyclopropane-fatty-acyl-phospholipid synthase
MSLTGLAARAVERAPIPDVISRLGVGYLVGRARRQLDAEGADETLFVREMDQRPIALATADANRQHYELPADFFPLILGPRRKYSSCLYEGAASLADAEERALAETCAHADLADGQDILELGCGWGSLSLWMAEQYPVSRITVVSNSASQRAHIEAEAQRRGFGHLRAITADMNDFAPDARFDRIVSVEMFEHMSNWRALLTRARGWLKPDGRLFLHVFTHRSRPYSFEVADEADWIAQHFFTGGIMPSHGLIRQFPDLFAVEAEWRWSGDHYRRTALHWLTNYDSNAVRIAAILRKTYGADWRVWRRRWRLFFLATAGLFGADSGEVWGVSHHRLKAATPAGIP